MRMTGIEKLVLGMIVFLCLFLAIALPISCARLNERGLKGVVDDVWYGPNKPVNQKDE
jgi:hypothetical protein